MPRIAAPSTILAAGLSASLVLGVAPAAVAADLSLRPAVHVKHRKTVILERRLWAARDYDGTAVVRRPFRTVHYVGWDGAAVVHTEYELVPAPRATPSHYLDGEPVLPNYPRNWPRMATLRYRMMSGLP
jgi:hypothetical protein